jgi:hypothetical protein
VLPAGGAADDAAEKRPDHNIVSLSGQRGGVGRGAYGSSKAGLEVLTRILAVELADYGINVKRDCAWADHDRSSAPDAHKGDA